MFLISGFATKVTCSLITETVSFYTRDRLSGMCSICNIHFRVKFGPQPDVFLLVTCVADLWIF